MSTKHAYYIVATALELLGGVDREDLSLRNWSKVQEIKVKLLRLRDELSGDLGREDGGVEL